MFSVKQHVAEPLSLMNRTGRRNGSLSYLRRSIIASALSLGVSVSFVIEANCIHSFKISVDRKLSGPTVSDSGSSTALRPPARTFAAKLLISGCTMRSFTIQIHRSLAKRSFF